MVGVRGGGGGGSSASNRWLIKCMLVSLYIISYGPKI